MRSLHLFNHHFLLSIFLSLAGSACATQSAEPILVPIEPAVLLAGAGNQTCALLANGDAACWGERAELSDQEAASSSPSTVRLNRAPTALAVSAFHACAVLDDGAVHCWGANVDNLLGLSNGVCSDLDPDGVCLTSPSATLVEEGAVSVATGGRWAVRPSSDSTDLLPRPLTCAVMESAEVLCWGDNSGQGLGTLDEILQRSEPGLVVETDGSPLRDIVDISVGDDEVYALDRYGDIWLWGANLPAGAQRQELPPAQHIATGAKHACLVTMDGAVVCWGNNTTGQAGDAAAAAACDPTDASDCLVGPTVVAGVKAAIQVAVGAHHSCALDQDGRVICWGSNQFYQLGFERASVINQPFAPALPDRAVQVMAGRGHTCALGEYGDVYCWGDSSLGQLGGVQ